MRFRFLAALGKRFRRAPPPGPGPRAETIAAEFLEARGYRVIARNLKTRYGEVDLLAEAPGGRVLVIVEVKSREFEGASDPYRRPEDRVNRRKQRRLATLACQLARRYRFTGRPIRFDVIGVDLPAHPARGEPIVRHHPGAFTAPAGARRV